MMKYLSAKPNFWVCLEAYWDCPTPSETHRLGIKYAGGVKKIMDFLWHLKKIWKKKNTMGPTTQGTSGNLGGLGRTILEKKIFSADVLINRPSIGGMDTMVHKEWTECGHRGFLIVVRKLYK